MGRFCDKHGVDLAELLEYSHGRLAMATLERYLPEASDVEREAEEAELLAWESGANDGVLAMPGAQAFLQGLSAPWTLVTSAVESLARTRFQVTGLPWPDVVVTAERVTAGKPDPQGYRLAAAELGLSVSECVVFEDAEPGIRAGLAAGAHVVVVGDFASDVTAGLPRIKDFADVRVSPSSDTDGFIVSV